MTGIFEQVATALYCKEPLQKCELTQKLNQQWTQNSVVVGPVPVARPKPGRPDLPILVAPSKVPKRGLGTDRGKAALMHAVAHIEFNAINMALDMILRFANSEEVSNNQLQKVFISDWLSVAADEARHFSLIMEYLNKLNFEYGDFPAHDGLWEASEQTAYDIAARLAVAPMVLEARGLDVTPFMINKFIKFNDLQAVKVLKVILVEEVAHVAIGTKWFDIIAQKRGRDPIPYFHELVRTNFKGMLKPPFNNPARYEAGLFEDFYLPLS
ncbi:MAG: ferritin-like domain-containing protein [Hellea sp.]|nr:ferritin-like domain-containing protein [Hellea sp.]